MKPTTKRLLSVAVSISMVSALGFVLAFVFQWPSHFVLGDVEDSRVTLQDLVAGTPASIPLTPWVVLVVATLLASSRRWWRTIGVIVLGLLGMVFVLGGWGEVFGPSNPHVPRLVLAACGVVYGLLGLSLSLCAVLDLIDRVRIGWAAKPGSEETQKTCRPFWSEPTTASYLRCSFMLIAAPVYRSL